MFADGATNEYAGSRCHIQLGSQSDSSLQLSRPFCNGGVGRSATFCSSNGADDCDFIQSPLLGSPFVTSNANQTGRESCIQCTSSFYVQHRDPTEAWTARADTDFHSRALMLSQLPDGIARRTLLLIFGRCWPQALSRIFQASHPFQRVPRRIAPSLQLESWPQPHQPITKPPSLLVAEKCRGRCTSSLVESGVNEHQATLQTSHISTKTSASRPPL